MTNDDEQFDNMLKTVALTSAQLAARMALAIQGGVSPNRVEAWAHSITPASPEQWAWTLLMSKSILDVVLTEIEYRDRFIAEQTGGK
jgi:hypothetical protein